MIDFNNIEAELGVKTLFTDAQQKALTEWYAAAIQGQALDHNPDTKTMGLPAAICAELARLTTLELEAHVDGSPRAEWIDHKLQKVLSPRRRRILAVALALGSGAWKPYQDGNDIGVAFTPADCIYPVSINCNGDLTEAVFINQIRTNQTVYSRLEWLHVLTSANDYHPKELERVRRMGVQPAREFPCVQVINFAYESSSKDSLGAPVTLQVRPEWQDIEPIAYLPGLEKLPIGYFVTPIVNTVDPSSELGAAMFAPAIPQIIDADVQFSRLDWEYEGGELGVDIDDQYLKPLGENGQALTDSEALRRFGVPAKALDKTMPEHTQRLFRGLNIDTGIADGGTFYQVFAPSLRDGNYLSGLNQYLRHVEQKVGLSYGVLSQVSELEKTATEIMSSKQKLYATVSDLQAALEDALRGLIDALDFWADQVDSAPPASGELQISFHWDDSIIVDRLTEMSQWQAELQLGLRSKAEYRQHFYGEDEETAAAAVAAIQQEAVAQDVLQGVLTQQAAPQSAPNAPAGKQTTGKPNGSQRGRQGPLKKGRP